jgi:OFA family oxalate/formate antiporter-like MFS transporter
MLTAWGFAGVLGPTLIAHVRQSTGYYTEALDLIAVIMLLSTALPFLVRPPKPSGEVLPVLLQKHA